MRARIGATFLAVFAAAILVFAGAAQAAAPSLGAASATNIQGVSALLKGSVDPEGLPTTYSFEYALAANFAGAAKTPAATAGTGTDARPARAALAGLSPNTTYYFRLVASNAAGTTPGSPATFTTTHGFGFLPGNGFTASAIAEGGAAATASGSHPYGLGFHLGFNQGGEFEGQPGIPFSDGDLRGLQIEMPPGLFLNPAALPKCLNTLFRTSRSSPFEASRSGESCPNITQVGTVEVRTSLGGGQVRRFGVFNLDPPPGIPAQIGFAPFGAPVVLNMNLRPNGDGSYVLTLDATNFPQSLDVRGIDLTLWGTPWGASHNGERGNCLNELEPSFPWAKCSVGTPVNLPPRAYLTLPATCSGPLAFTARATSWQQPAEVSAGAVNRTSQGKVAEMSCGGMGFNPHSVALLSTKKASSASGLAFRLDNENETLLLPERRVSPQARKAVVALPEGVTINPSIGAGLGVCAPGQYAAETAFSNQGAACPNASKIGDFTVRSPFFDEWFEGAIYLARSDDPATASPGAENPFDTLIAVYLVAKLPQRGLLVKIAGKIVPDSSTGRLTATFDQLPQLPYSELEVNFRSGQRAPLITPPFCGAATTQIEITPWATSLAPAHASTPSPIETGIGGGPCPTGATPPFAPTAIAGGVNSNVGSYTPYFVHLARKDTEQEITSYSLVLPKGITGKLAGIPFCPDAAIVAARNRRGFAEMASPSCPVASEVGHTLTGYGIGAPLTYASGKIYLAGPYHGSPLSLVTINAATVGPFDLGTIVIRSAFDIDEYTAQLRIDSRASDPIPHIVDGIPLHLRDIRVYMDRPQFTHNPSSCAPSEMVSTLTGSGGRFGDPSDDSVATVSKHFQLLNCLTLGFKPKLGIRLRGGSRRGAYPSLRATFAARGPQDSNLKQIAVTTPRSMFLAQEHIKQICSAAQYRADACPAGSVYGSAVAYTPLFDNPLRGSVYLVSSKGRLPDLVASLRSGAVHITLEGEIGPAKYGIRTAFNELPDAPINRFVMTLFGGRRGLLVNSANVCSTPPLASVKALGQNNLGAVFTSELRGQCGKKKHHKQGKR